MTNKKGEVRELTRGDIKLFRPAIEPLPEIFGKEMAETLMQRRLGQRCS